MIVAVTGGTGFVGGHLCEALGRAGHQVRALVRSPHKADRLHEQGFEVVQADVTQPETLRAGLQGCEVLVANAALGSGQGDLAAMHRINVEGVRHSLSAAAQAGVRRVVLISTTAVYRTRVNTVLTETATPTDPTRRRWDWKDLTTDWRYAMTKKRGEDLAFELADELGLALTAIQPCPVYGPRDPKFTRRLLQGLDRRLTVLPTAGVPMVHAVDVAEAVARAVERPQTAGQRYIVAGPPVSLARLVRTLVALAGRGPRVIPVPVPIEIRYDCAAAHRDLDFEARPVEQGLAQLLEG